MAKRAGSKGKAVRKVVEEGDRGVPPEVRKIYKELLAERHKGLRRLTDGALLSSRMVR